MNKRKELVWRGQATVDSISSTQKGDEKRVLSSVEKMFKQYPPVKKITIKCLQRHQIIQDNRVPRVRATADLERAA